MPFRTQTLSPADVAHGYRFGENGFVSRKDAAEHLKVSIRQVDRLIDAGKLRRSKSGDKRPCAVRICKRSLTEYVASLEY